MNDHRLVEHATEVPAEAISATDTHQLRRETSSQEDLELQESLNGHGILTPLIVQRAPEGFTLITGRRRLAQARALGLTRVPIILAREDLEPHQALSIAIEEQIRNKPLTPAERAETAAKLKALYDERHPGAKRGRPRTAKPTKQAPPESPDERGAEAPDTAHEDTPKSNPQRRVPPATVVIAQTTGTSQRTAQRDARIGAHLIPEAKEALDNGKITKSQAYSLSGKAPAVQAEALTSIKAQTPRNGSSSGSRRATRALLELLDRADTKLLAFPDDHKEAIRNPWVRGRVKQKVEGLANTCQLVLARLNNGPGNHNRAGKPHVRSDHEHEQPLGLELS